MAGGVAQGEGPEFKSQYHKKKIANASYISNRHGRVLGKVFNHSLDKPHWL
jgi:hypothetical protein